MSKALVGTHADIASLRLLDEIRSLRARIAELEAALARAEAQQPGVEVPDAEVDRGPSADGAHERATVVAGDSVRSTAAR